MRDLVKVRGEVEFVAPESLPNDGKVIDDVRIYSETDYDGVSFSLCESAAPIMTKPILAALVASFLAAGCAADPAVASGEQRAEPVYRTGSNISVRNRDCPADGPLTINRDDLERTGASYLPPGPIPKGQ